MPDDNGKPVKGVSDEFAIMDELPPEDPRAPGGPRTSHWEARLERVKSEVPPGKVVCIRTYLNKNAASAAATDLRRKYGNGPEAYGFSFAVRTVKQKDGVKRGLFVTYTPDKIVKGAEAKQAETYTAWKTAHDARLKKTAQERAAKAKAEAAA